MATITSVADGYWDQAGTWDGVPTIDDDVVIAHTVTIRDENALCLSVTVNAGKQLVFECANGATKITFKDDATAKIVNNGTITIQNTTATKKCTWAGGSTTNKVDFQTQGTLNQADYWHLEYVKFSDSANLSTAKKIFVDKDVQTDSWTITDPGEVEVAAGVTWVVGHSGENGVDYIYAGSGGKLRVKGTSGSGVLIRGTDVSNRMLYIQGYGGSIFGDYLTVRYAQGGGWGVFRCEYSILELRNPTVEGNDIHCIVSRYHGDVYLKNPMLTTTATQALYLDWGCAVIEGGSITGGSYWARVSNSTVKVKSAALSPNAYATSVNEPLHLAFFKKLTLTVKTGDTPIQGAYCSLIQDHAEDYALIDEVADGGYTDANGQVVLYGLWKVVDEDGNVVYYSDENNNGPSGTKEKHLLKVVKENYWPSQDESYYMSQDRSDTVYLTPYDLGAGRVVKFGTFQFPHVQSVAEIKRRGFVEKFIPDRQIAYRKDIGGYGRSWRVTGYIDTDIWNTKAAIQNLADGTARTFDRGTGEALVDCIMLDPDFAETVDAYGRLAYTVTLMEQSNP